MLMNIKDWNYPISEAIFSIAFLSTECGKLLNYLHTYKSTSAYKGGVRKNLQEDGCKTSANGLTSLNTNALLAVFWIVISSM